MSRCSESSTRRMSLEFTAPLTEKLLFLGDFVDRGEASLEVILFVLALKVLSPGNVHLLRGNHELKVPVLPLTTIDRTLQGCASILPLFDP